MSDQAIETEIQAKGLTAPRVTPADELAKDPTQVVSATGWPFPNDPPSPRTPEEALAQGT